MWWLLTMACGGGLDAQRLPVDRSEVASQLTGNFRDGPISLQTYGASRDSIASTVTPVRFNLRPGFQISGALWTPKRPSGVGVIVAHGHYGQGKSGAEAQEVAHRLAARGAYVLAVDTPGVEEWNQAGRQIHFAEGAHNRGWLVASGTSAMALQIDVLRRGLDVLESLGAERFGVTGASGGAVQAFYLAWVDARIEAVAMASVPRIPREAAAGGCTCDQIPGHPGPDPSTLAAVRQPVLWLSDVQQPRPEGLGTNAKFVIQEGPHSYTDEMQRQTLTWFEEHLSLPEGDWENSVPGYDLSTGSAGTIDSMPISMLPVHRNQEWTPTVERGGGYQLACVGSGPVVITLGATPQTDIVNAGFTACAVTIPTPPGVAYDELALAKSIGEGKVRVEALAGAVLSACSAQNAVAVWAHRSWGLVAGITGLPFVVQDPVRTFEEIDPQIDPPWIHVPGAWAGGIDLVLSKSLATGKEAGALLDAILAQQD